MSNGSVNKVTIIGRLGKDPEVRTFQNGGSVCEFSVATSESWTDKATGERKEKTEWHRIKAFGKLAEICGAYIQKGKMVYLEGSLTTEEWEKDGVKHTATKVKLSEMQMLSPKDGAGQQSQQQTYQPQQPQYGHPYHGQQQQPYGAPSQPPYQANHAQQQPRQTYPQQPPAGQYRQPQYQQPPTGPEQGEIPF